MIPLAWDGDTAICGLYRVTVRPNEVGEQGSQGWVEWTWGIQYLGETVLPHRPLCVWRSRDEAKEMAAFALERIMREDEP